MKEPTQQKVQLFAHCLVSVILGAIKRNGIEKTIEDLQHNCRSRPASDEYVYQDLLGMLNAISETREGISKFNQRYN